MLAVVNTKGIVWSMKIPHHIVKGINASAADAELLSSAVSDPRVSKWIVAAIRNSTPRPVTPRINGRPRIDETQFIAVVEKAAPDPTPRTSVIAAMQSVFPLSKTAAIGVLNRMEKRGVITVERGPLQWSSVMVRFFKGDSL